MSFYKSTTKVINKYWYISEGLRTKLQIKRIDWITFACLKPHLKLWLWTKSPAIVPARWSLAMQLLDFSLDLETIIELEFSQMSTFSWVFTWAPHIKKSLSSSRPPKHNIRTTTPKVHFQSAHKGHVRI